MGRSEKGLKLGSPWQQISDTQGEGATQTSNPQHRSPSSTLCRGPSILSSHGAIRVGFPVVRINNAGPKCSFLADRLVGWGRGETTG